MSEKEEEESVNRVLGKEDGTRWDEVRMECDTMHNSTDEGIANEILVEESGVMDGENER